MKDELRRAGKTVSTGALGGAAGLALFGPPGAIAGAITAVTLLALNKLFE